MKPLIYLASPYSDTNPAVRKKRYEIALEKCAELILDGYMVFSPIVHSHPIAVHIGAAYEWEIWKELDRAILLKCDELWVLPIYGWNYSRGVTEEMRIAQEAGIPVKIIDL